MHYHSFLFLSFSSFRVSAANECVESVVWVGVVCIDHRQMMKPENQIEMYAWYYKRCACKSYDDKS